MDNPRRDAQDPQVNNAGSDSGHAPPDPPSGDGGKRDPLVEFLHKLNEERGNKQTAKLLGVDRKTVWRALDAGRLTPWLRNALERERLAAEREAAGEDQLELRVEGLERRLRDVEGRLASDLGSLRDEVRTLAWTRTGTDGASSNAASTSSAPRSPHRTYRQVVTVDELPDDAEVFGEATPLIAEWRDQRARFKTHWPSVEGLEAEVRMLELEMELIEERKLTLPPGRLPWEWDQRRREARRRTQRLGTARSNLRRARWRRRLVQLATLGLANH